MPEVPLPNRCRCIAYFLECFSSSDFLCWNPIFLIGKQYAAKEFGTCPLVQCAGQPVLPAGLKDEMGTDTVKIFCPKCQCVYHPPPVRSRSSHHGGAGAAGGCKGFGHSDGLSEYHRLAVNFRSCRGFRRRSRERATTRSAFAFASLTSSFPMA